MLLISQNILDQIVGFHNPVDPTPRKHWIYFLKKLFLSNRSRYCHQISSDKFLILSSFKRCVTYLSKHSGSNCRKTDYLIGSNQLLENIGIYFFKKNYFSQTVRDIQIRFLILSSFKRCVTYLSKHSGSNCRKTDYLIGSNQLFENIDLLFKKIISLNRSRCCHQICLMNSLLYLLSSDVLLISQNILDQIVEKQIN